MNQQQGGDSKESWSAKHPIWMFIILAFAVIAVQGFGWWAMTRWLTGHGERGEFGDMFGSINTLFSGLAFAGVICAILLQRHELILQREELTATRNELKKSAEAQTRSELALKEQAKMMLLTAKIHGFTTVIEANQAAFHLPPQWMVVAGAPDEHLHAWMANLKQLQDIMLEIQSSQNAGQPESSPSTSPDDNKTTP